MRRFGYIALLTLFGCSAHPTPQPVQNPAVTTCTGADVPVYNSRFAAQAGGSGVATGADAVAGKINSDPSSGGGVSEGGATGSVPSSPTSGTSSPSDPTTATTPPTPDPQLTAMVMTCGQVPCGAGLVAVEAPPALGSSPGSGGGGIEGPAGVGSTIDSSGAPTTKSTGTDTTTTTGVAPTTGTAVSPPASTPPTSTTPTTPAPTTGPSGNYLCVEPPPTCATGLSPQFTLRGVWECTDCTFVVTYGGIYGNYRRCVSAPTLACDTGEVPTWVYEDDQWECKATCDNGQYDQHTIVGMTVCVPC